MAPEGRVCRLQVGPSVVWQSMVAMCVLCVCVCICVCVPVDVVYCFWVTVCVHGVCVLGGSAEGCLLCEFTVRLGAVALCMQVQHTLYELYLEVVCVVLLSACCNAPLVCSGAVVCFDRGSAFV
jgi:hypothetical protein